jgi:glucose/arabinose dehydrogenase
MGDDLPDDELNHAPEAGLHFGFPYCHADGIRDPQFGRGHNCSRYREPEALLGPHVAALGMRFYQGEQFPEEYRGGMFIAQRGSWNRSEKIGYRIAFASRNETGVDVRIFASGWLQGDEVWGRPVDVQEMPDGALLVSDDHAGVIYRIAYAPET